MRTALAWSPKRIEEQEGSRGDTPLIVAWLLVREHWLGIDAGFGACASARDAIARIAAAVGDGHAIPGGATWGSLRIPPRDPSPGLEVVAPEHVAFIDEGCMTVVCCETTLCLDRPIGLLDNAAATAMLAAVTRVADRVVAEPDARLVDLDPLEAAQRARLLADRGPASSRATLGRTVNQALLEQAARTPDAEALAWRGGSRRYRELAAASAGVATRLARAGVVHGDVVAVALARSADAIATLLGVWRAGAACLPLDAALPPARVNAMLDAAAARVVVVPADGAPASSPWPPGMTTVAFEPALWETSSTLGETESGDDPIASILFTSGSTGEPKGIEVRHASILRLVEEPSFMRLSASERMLHAAPLGFDASTLEIWGPLLHGGTCVLHDEDLPTGPGLARTIRDLHVTSAWLTASLFNAVVDDDPTHLRGLDQLLVGGEALSVAHVRAAMQALSDTRLINGYGPTECTTFATTHAIPRDLPADAPSVPIGRPIQDTVARILSPTMQPVPDGWVGELWLGGRGLARGYAGRRELTRERFVTDPFGEPGERLYRTGDLVRRRPDDGAIEYLGRIDRQVKVRGFRIELAEVERALACDTAVRACAVMAERDGEAGTRLVAYAVPSGAPQGWSVIRDRLARVLPVFMLPSELVWVDAMPLTVSGKLDREALRRTPRRRSGVGPSYAAPVGSKERLVCEVFASLLGLHRAGRHDHFFELGGHSLLATQAVARFAAAGLPMLPAIALFEHPTPASLAAAMVDGAASSAPISSTRTRQAPGPERADEPIAIIAMAGRFPGAGDIEAFWQNLRDGRDTVRHFTPAELDPSLPLALVADPDYVAARGVLDGVEQFDAAFFGIPPGEADLLDPQQRILLELSWECLERAGHPPDREIEAQRTVGVFAGMYNATYWQRHLATRPDIVAAAGEFQVMLGNEKDYVATRVAHRLDLTGPAISVHTACSTSLVAIAQAMTSLRSGQCDLALAGGAAVTCPPRSGYRHEPGGMLSPDGRTRPFSADAAGTVFSDGAGVVLLRRLSDALADGDTVHAVLRSVAVNNDGRDKASFTAPSVAGQAAVIRAALDAAGVDARDISYVEAHGTATPLGDPVEVEALTRAYRRDTADTGYCGIGSVKGNIGHTVVAAGVAGVIKTTLALRHQMLPPSLHADVTNPVIEFEAGPFRVIDTARPWPRGDTPRRAGVSAFGVGGTNAHAVLEEAPPLRVAPASVGPHLLLLSAKTASALRAARERLADHLAAHPDDDLGDVAHTLQRGRSRFPFRAHVVATTHADAVARLRAIDGPDAAQASRGVPRDLSNGIVFAFPGQGAQVAGMGRDLHAAVPAFREALDAALAAMADEAPADLRARLFDGDAAALADTAVTQPALFAVCYALARMWQSAGLVPAALVGHSVGEFVAAVLAGVMSLADAARLVALRGRLMQALPGGSMLAVRMSPLQLASRLPADVSIAAENAPMASVVAGPVASIAALKTELDAQGEATRLLATSHAFHSEMMEAAVAPFEAAVRAVALHPPHTRIVSTLTGCLLSEAEATDPAYWSHHLRTTVRFQAALESIAALVDEPVLLECGPRATLTGLVFQQSVEVVRAMSAVASLADNGAAPERENVLSAAGRLWSLGVDIDTASFFEATVDGMPRRRIVLPTYPFERRRHWIDAPPASGAPPVVVMARVVAMGVESAPAAVHASPSAARGERLVRELRTLLETVSGVEMAQVPVGAAFVELGLDSLALTQVALQVRRTFKVEVTFRQLMESLRSLDALAAHLDDRLPTETASAAVVAPPAPADAGMAASLGAIQLQMAAIAQQLASLGAQQPAPQRVAEPGAVAPQTVPAATDAPPPITYDVKTAFGAIARIHGAGAEPITPRQRARLDALIRRYVERTARSKAYTTEHRAHLADPRVVNGFRPLFKEITYQIVVERSKGARLWDIDGNAYVDALNGFGMNLFGWQPDFVLAAVRAQLDSGYDIGPQHPLAGPVARLVCELTGFDRAALCNTGSEAVMGCVRIARTVTGRSRIVIFSGAYHGIFDEVIVRATKSMRAFPAAPGIMPSAADNVVVLEYGAPESLRWIEANADDLAAVLVEPVQSRRPDLQPVAFLGELRDITSRTGTLLVFDEVVTGFRSHPGGAQALFGVRADLAAYGKVIGGGFPIGVIAGRRDCMDALDGGDWRFGDDSVPSVGVTYFAGTFVRHPLALAAAKAVLDRLEAEGPELQAQLTHTTASMVDDLNAWCRRVGAPIVLKSFASVWKVFFTEDHPLQDLLFAMMRSRGVHILDHFPCFFTTAHTPHDVAAIVSAFKESVVELQESEFVPRGLADTVLADAAKPPVANARLGRDRDGNAAWYVPDPDAPGRYRQVEP